MKKTVCLLLAIVMLLGVVLTGCSKKTDKEGTPDGANNEAERVLVIAQGSDLKNFDPANHLASSTDTIIDNMASSLLKYDSNMDIVMDLATEYEMTGRAHLGVYHPGTTLRSRTATSSR